MYDFPKVTFIVYTLLALVFLKFSSGEETKEVKLPSSKKNSGVSAKKLFIANLNLWSPPPSQDPVATREADG